jgi:class 3 adenylate cyclase
VHIAARILGQAASGEILVSAEVRLASTPTPGPRTPMRRSDRAVEVTGSRTPWILRGMSRLAPAIGRG